MTGDVCEGTEGPQAPDTVQDRAELDRIEQIRQGCRQLIHEAYLDSAASSDALSTILSLMHEALQLGDDVPDDALRRHTHWLNESESLTSSLFLAAHSELEDERVGT